MILSLSLGLLFLFFGAGFYVAVTLGLIAFILMYFFADRPLWDILGSLSWNVNTNFVLVSIPLYILMGEILLRSGITDLLYTTLARWLNWLPGGVLHANIASCAMFAAMSGSSAATAATIGSVAMPSLLQKKYNEPLLLGSLAAGGTLGILIPPSIILVLYGVLAEESIGRLYLAGFIPGFILAGLFMVIIFAIAKIRPSIAPREAVVTWKLRVLGTVQLLPTFVLIFLVLGTIYVGIATPVEAAGFGVVGAFVIALLFRKVNLEMLRETFLSTVRTTALIMLIVTIAVILNFALSIFRAPQQISDWVLGLGLPITGLMFALVVIYIIMGMFLETFTITVTTIPIFAPVLKSLGVDLVWFGIIFTILIEMALITPPVGFNVWVIQGVRRNVRRALGLGERSMTDVYVGSMPFLLAMLGILVLVIYFPAIATWLPDLVKGVAK